MTNNVREDVTMKSPSSAAIRLLRRFVGDRSGIGAVEFAIIVPILLMIYITSFELTIGFSVAKRATNAAGSIADIVTQKNTVDKPYLATMNDVSAAVLAPYVATGAKLKISGIKIDPTGKPTYLWSWNQDNGRPYTNGATASVPDDMKTPNSFLVRAEVTVPHTLLMFMPNFMPNTLNTININRDYYFTRRQGTEVLCPTC